MDISIHPMLFFIEMIVYFNSPTLKFQYIQCYFLSERRNILLIFILHFNTSNVIFYRLPGGAAGMPGSISIHPMLFFIKMQHLKI